MKHLDLLGFKATDRITGFEGIISNVSFDLYGCVQAVLTPPITRDEKTGKVALGESHWFDVSRLIVSTEPRVMEPPSERFAYEPAAIPGGQTYPDRDELPER